MLNRICGETDVLLSTRQCMSQFSPYVWVSTIASQVLADNHLHFGIQRVTMVSTHSWDSRLLFSCAYSVLIPHQIKVQRSIMIHDSNIHRDDDTVLAVTAKGLSLIVITALSPWRHTINYEKMFCFFFGFRKYFFWVALIYTRPCGSPSSVSLSRCVFGRVV